MTNATLSGSCLCGAVQYEVEGEVLRFSHCHCSRCRKATGTGHATNVVLKPTRFAWTQGEELVRRYKLPEAERFATAFCATCGSPLPRVSLEPPFALIPAGSLDVDPPLKPQMHIFWDSRTEWSCPAGDLPVFSEYPPSS
jgi:hypothetical protein